MNEVELINKVENICYNQDSFVKGNYVKLINEPSQLVITTTRDYFNYQMFKEIFYSGIIFWIVGNKMIINKEMNISRSID